MARYLMLVCLIILTLLGWACSDDDNERFPNMVTEFANVRSDSLGQLYEFTTDGGETYSIQNRLTGYDTCRVYRTVCGYEAQGRLATIYELQGVYVLRDSSAVARHDPTDVLSVWGTPHYLNMQLIPKTHGGRHHWGFVLDSLKSGHAFLSLHHSQNGDDTAYTTTVYASLPLDSIRGLQPGDSVSLFIQGFQGMRRFHLRWPFERSNVQNLNSLRP